ncbi:argininosuccinate synthase [Saccharothrix sp. S26]|uniref:argininosuccinate synthase domain-containing protein n=1 Tax=Saccharothrix sp. S26 TaxID=2907215 RepID=UPI001F3D745E|nr:argininosuccinate synthase domain-containing protein [Saccharothrix sp. S26]MCE6994124.1 argininosuccinate synthase [Saccharothrix sp. S26]
MSERVVLACSDGSDALRLLAGRAEVVAVVVDPGRGEDPEELRRRALDGGAVDAVVAEARDEFADRYCLPALRANALRSASALFAPLVAEHVVETARRFGVTTVAHDRAGADRTRFEAGVAALAPDLTVLTVAPADERADHRPVGRIEPGDPDELVVTFDRGRPVAIDGETVTMPQAVRELNRRAGVSGVGRLTGVPAYDTPGASALTTAHQQLEDVTLEPDLVRFKRQVERRWGALVHEGLWFSPLKQALDSFIDDTQRHVSGEVRLVLHGGRAVVAARRGEEPPAPGCAPPRGLPTKIAAKRDSIT